MSCSFVVIFKVFNLCSREWKPCVMRESFSLVQNIFFTDYSDLLPAHIWKIWLNSSGHPSLVAKSCPPLQKLSMIFKSLSIGHFFRVLVSVSVLEILVLEKSPCVGIIQNFGLVTQWSWEIFWGSLQKWKWERTYKTHWCHPAWDSWWLFFEGKTSSQPSPRPSRPPPPSRPSKPPPPSQASTAQGCQLQTQSGDSTVL